MNLVTIVYDPKTRRIRARYLQGWVRFPRHLRNHGSIYHVENLILSKAGSYIAKGRIDKVFG